MDLIPVAFEILIPVNNVSEQDENGNLVGKMGSAEVELKIDDTPLSKNSIEMNAYKVFEGMPSKVKDLTGIRDGIILWSADVGLVPMSECIHSYCLVFDPGGGLDCETGGGRVINMDVSLDQFGCSFFGADLFGKKFIKCDKISMPFDRGRFCAASVDFSVQLLSGLFKAFPIVFDPGGSCMFWRYFYRFVIRFIFDPGGSCNSISATRVLSTSLVWGNLYYHFHVLNSIDRRQCLLKTSTTDVPNTREMLQKLVESSHSEHDFKCLVLGQNGLNNASSVEMEKENGLIFVYDPGISKWVFG